MTNKTPYILINDNDGGSYIIPESEKKNFWAWIDACEAGQFAKIKKFDYFNKNRIDLPKLVIYEWEERT